MSKLMKTKKPLYYHAHLELKETSLKLAITTIILSEKIKEHSEKLNHENHAEKNDKKVNLLLSELHDLLVHPGRNKMINTLRGCVQLKNMKKAISKICKECPKCATEKNITQQWL
ncbi:hypothetical protein DMUE_1438 [Dictyocoela muelleri]|nr:hypothetical protein DMUE_1438 [Dictyocoela muelleri]